MSARSPYVEAYEIKGVWASRRYFVARRLTQAAFLLVFLTQGLQNERLWFRVRFMLSVRGHGFPMWPNA